MRYHKPYWGMIMTLTSLGTFLIGYGAGMLTTTTGTGDYAIAYADGFDAARKKIDASGMFPPPAEKITSVSGKVVRIDGASFTIAAGPVSLNPLDPQGPETRIVKTGGPTEYFAMVPLTSDEFTAAMAKFNKDSADGKAVSPPNPYAEIPATFDDIRIGMNISVFASSDIRDAATINAAKIIFTAIPAAPTQ